MASDVAIKVKIARQFSRAASHYDGVAAVQWDIAQDALGGLPKRLAKILDIGAGTGRITRLLTAHSDRVIGLDIAEGMARYARDQQGNNAQVQWLVGDAEALPIANASVDGVFSSMALQWCSPMATVLEEIKRVLRPGGVARLAILADGSLQELGHSWRRVDIRAGNETRADGESRHLNHYPTAESLLQGSHHLGFLVTSDVRRYVTWHSSLGALLASIKDIGANTRIDVQSENPSGSRFNRRVYQWLQQAYGDFADDSGKLPLTYDVCHLTLIKPNAAEKS